MHSAFVWKNGGVIFHFSTLFTCIAIGDLIFALKSLLRSLNELLISVIYFSKLHFFHILFNCRALCKCISSFFSCYGLFSLVHFILTQKYFAWEMQFWENTFFSLQTNSTKKIIDQNVCCCNKPFVSWYFICKWPPFPHGVNLDIKSAISNIESSQHILVWLFWLTNTSGFYRFWVR